MVRVDVKEWMKEGREESKERGDGKETWRRNGRNTWKGEGSTGLDREVQGWIWMYRSG